MPSDPETPSPAAAPSARPRSRNVRGEGEKLRSEILDAMLRLMADEARMQPVPLSLREVAREAGITAPAIYRHFPDKESLSRAAFAQLFGLLLETLDQADTEAAALPPAGRLAALAHAYCRFAQENTASFRIMFSAADLGGSGPEEVGQRWNVAVARLAETGLRLAQTPEAAAISVWSSVHGRILLGRPLGGNEWDDDVHAFIDALTRSLATV
ncbi:MULTISPECIES: TetR/AcrR family transcriptional regulator [Streptomyces]|uniref:TetR/AcrR family transcriptional regulator n=1 Tax=Streptomyces salyersiae TaxID=3075530 RepID=A0ABU2RCM7_9ACTN|nr:TetR/AcrR family transcriptional regulator [Streptomyces sp. DSM 41770]MDT0426564.1 TetR/AcrR family transcriptional regulator [Streptomyces sp. DSM 41770]